jgi:hypothetical protein
MTMEAKMKSNAEKRDKMIRTMKPILGVLVVALVMFSTGCVQIMEQKRLEDFPTYSETVRAWPKLNEGFGRIFVYFPRQGAGVADIAVGPGIAKVIYLTFDEHMKTRMRDGTFLFADLAEGKHSVAFKYSTFKKAQVIEVDLQAGNTVYIRVDAKHIGDPAWVFPGKPIFGYGHAPLHHSYMEALPVNDQPKDAANASFW